MRDSGVVEVPGDLAAPKSLRGVGHGVVTVVHLASRIGGTYEQCMAVNGDGTAALLDEVRGTGVHRVIYVSTTSVYGNGTHRGVSESMLAPAPVSVTSTSRLAAERTVRAAGGIVLRPHLIYGRGDTWFVPTILRLLRHVPAWIEGGRAMTSVVAVDDLAEVVLALTRMPWQPTGGTVFHVSHPQPVSMRTLTTTVCDQLGLPLPDHDLAAAVHRVLTRRAMPELTDHQFSLLANDHWYDSRRIWRHTAVPCGPSPMHRLRSAVGWYREVADGFSAGSVSTCARLGTPPREWPLALGRETSPAQRRSPSTAGPIVAA
jgi:nucleoside-diphosphate-sugar epimerase